MTWPRPAPVLDSSFLGAYARAGAFTDCYEAAVPASVDLPLFIQAFYTTRLFKLERWLLAKVLHMASTDGQALDLAHARTHRFSAWKVECRSGDEILLDAGQTRSWLSARTLSISPPRSALSFGSAVVPRHPGGKFGWVFHVLLGFHRLYSRLLLAAAAKRVVALSEAQRGT